VRRAKSPREASEPGVPHLRQVRKDAAAAAEPAQPDPAKPPLSDDERRYLDRGKRFNDFLNDVETNPALKQHILAFWNGEAARAAQPDPVEDPLDGYDERDRKALSKLLEQNNKQWEAKLEAAVAPFKEQLAQAVASREFEALSTEDPNWKTWVTPDELKGWTRRVPRALCDGGLPPPESAEDPGIHQQVRSTAGNCPQRHRQGSARGVAATATREGREAGDD
jgi:hypothetical protein